MQTHPYIGMWITADGHIRQELLPNGRYDEARGTRKSAYQGRYEVTGDHATIKRRVAMLETALAELGNYESETELIAALEADA